MPNTFYIEDIDGCEFVVSKIVGRMLISFHRNADGYETGLIHCVYPDGSQCTKTEEEAQGKLDSGEWTVIRG